MLEGGDSGLRDIVSGVMGSGTVALVCYQLSRRYLGYEINKDFCEIPEIRLKQRNLTKFT